MNYLESVAQFHRTFQHPILQIGEDIKPERAELRFKLLAEELKELREGIDNKDIVEIADALCDLQYVLSGAVLEFGLKDVFQKLFDEVHSSNMSKACLTDEDVEETIAANKLKFPDQTFSVDTREELFFITNSDGKTVKSCNYRPADLESILRRAFKSRVHING